MTAQHTYFVDVADYSSSTKAQKYRKGKKPKQSKTCSSTERERTCYILIINKKIHSSCKIEDFVETHVCKLCVILRSRVSLGVCPH